MDELYEIVRCLNRVKDKVVEISDKIDNLKEYISNTPPRELNEIYVDEVKACEILHVRPRILSDLRKKMEIPIIKHHRKILYPVEGLYAYLEKYST